MPELPDRPDIDQLRHQARDLHREATAGVPAALARIRRFSDRIVLSSAQLAVAREYGYPSWPALQAEVKRRSLLPAATGQPAGEPSAPGWLDPRYSFGGGLAIQAAEGVLSPEVLTVSDGTAVLHASAVLYAPAAARRAGRGFNREGRPRFNDLAAADDKEATLSLRFAGGSLHFPRSDEDQQPSDLSFWVDPVPSADAKWIELRTQPGAATRLFRSPRAAVRVGDVAVVSAREAAERKLEGLAFPDAANQADGQERHLDINVALPRIDGVAVQLDHLVSQPGSWSLYMRALPGWWGYSDDGHRKWEVVSVSPEDDRGGRYVSSFGGSSGHGDHEDLRLRFLPRLDPLARSLKLRFSAGMAEVAADLDLTPVA